MQLPLGSKQSFVILTQPERLTRCSLQRGFPTGFGKPGPCCISFPPAFGASAARPAGADADTFHSAISKLFVNVGAVVPVPVFQMGKLRLGGGAICLWSPTKPIAKSRTQNPNLLTVGPVRNPVGCSCPSQGCGSDSALVYSSVGQAEIQ